MRYRNRPGVRRCAQGELPMLPASAAVSPGITGFFFSWPAGQFWQGGFSTFEFVAIVSVFSLVFRKRLRVWLHEHRLATRSHLSKELNRLEEWMEQMLNGDGVLEEHHARMRSHVSAEITRLEHLITQAVPAIQEAPAGRGEQGLWILPWLPVPGRTPGWPRSAARR